MEDTFVRSDLDELIPITEKATQGRWVPLRISSQEGPHILSPNYRIAVCDYNVEHDANHIATFNPTYTKSLLLEMQGLYKKLDRATTMLKTVMADELVEGVLNE